MNNKNNAVIQGTGMWAGCERSPEFTDAEMTDARTRKAQGKIANDIAQMSAPVGRATVTAQVVPKLLSDGSLVYDVQVLDSYGSVIEFEAINERVAVESASDIRIAIERAAGRIG